MATMDAPFRSSIPSALLPVTLTAFAATVAMAYHGPYWSTFDITILHYATLTDIFRLCAGPLALILAGWTLGIFVVSAMPQNEPDKGWRRVVRTADVFLVLLLCAGVIALIYGWATGKYWRHALAMMLLAGAPIRFGKHITTWLFPNLGELGDAIMRTVMFGLPLLAIGLGWSDAEAVRDGERYMRLNLLDSSGWPASLSLEETRYLGRTSEVLLLYQAESKKVLVIPASAVGAYQLTRVPAREHSSFRQFVRGE